MIKEIERRERKRENLIHIQLLMYFAPFIGSQSRAKLRPMD